MKQGGFMTLDEDQLQIDSTKIEMDKKHKEVEIEVTLPSQEYLEHEEELKKKKGYNFVPVDLNGRYVACDKDNPDNLDETQESIKEMLDY